MKRIIIVILIFTGKISIAQLSLGAAFGTFNVPGAVQNFKGYAPTLRVEYTGGEETQQLFLDATLFKKNYREYDTEITDDAGNSLGEADTKESYSIKHLQLGFKRSLAGNFTDTKLNCFIGGGLALSFINTTYKYSLAGASIPNDKVGRKIFGFHFNTGAQWRIKPIVLELRGNFDLVVKPVEVGGGDNSSYIITSLRVGIMVPIIKY